MKPITVLVIDEHPEVSAGLGKGLGRLAGFRVIAHTTNVLWAAELARYWKPEIIIVDLKRGPRSRPDIVRWLKEMSPRSRIVVFSPYFADNERHEFLEAGASLCLLKGLTLNELGFELSGAIDMPNYGIPRRQRRRRRAGAITALKSSPH